SMAGLADVMSAVCNGDAQAGILAQSSLLSATPSNCPKGPLATLSIPEATFWFGVGAQKQKREAKVAADIIRNEIGKMAADGALAGIDFRWGTRLSTEASTIFQYGNAQSNSLFLLVGLAALALVLGAMLVLVRRLRLAQRQAEAASIAKSEFLA